MSDDFRARMAARRESIRQARETAANWPEWKQKEMRRWRADTKRMIEESINERD